MQGVSFSLLMIHHNHQQRRDYRSLALSNLACSGPYTYPGTRFRRSYSIPPGRLPKKEPRASELRRLTTSPSLQVATEGVPAVGESGRSGCTDRGDCPGALGVDDENDTPKTATITDAESDEVTALRELVQNQKEDLEMAAFIGQRLLDSTEELSAKLEVMYC